MCCKNICRLCDKLVITEAVTFTAATATAPATLSFELPDGSYRNREKYCIIIAQEIPDETTINAQVVFTIGDGTRAFPLLDPNCRQVTASAIRTRTKYSTKVVTNAAGGNFKLLEKPCCAPNNDLTALDADV